VTIRTTSITLDESIPLTDYKQLLHI